MHTNTSQEVQSQVLAALLKPIRDLPQNWEVDLAKQLEKYLHQLCEMSNSSNGINFAEAALLIQTSAGIYGKKVEYLWQILQQVLDSFREEKRTNGKGNEAGPKKRSPCTSDSFRDFLEIEPTRDKDKKKKDEHQKPIQFQPYIYSQLENKAASNKRINIFGNMLELLGNKADFRLNNQISNRFILEEEMSVLMSITPAQPLSSELVTNNTSTMEISLNASRMEVDPIDPVEEPSCMPVNVNDHRMEHNDELGDHYNDCPSDNDFALPSEKEFVNKRVGQQPRERLVTVPAPVEHWKATDGLDKIPDKLLKRRISYKLPCDIALLKPDASRKRKHEERRIDVMTIMVRMLTTDSRKWGLGKKLFDNAQDFRIEYLSELKNRQRRDRLLRQRERKELHKKLSKEFTGDFPGFEDYEPSSGEEDGFAGYPDELPEPPEEEFPLPPTFQNAEPEPIGHAGSDSQINTESYQAVVQQKLEEFAAFGKQCQQSKLAMRVNEWHKSIRPVLEAAHQRGHFDIHQYGTRILESFPRDNRKTTIAFADVVRGEAREDVSRYFLASLMLANTYNVEISKSDPQELAMDCMELTLLKSSRHHEALDDYEAPSQAKRSPSSFSAGASQTRPVHSGDHRRKRGK